MVCDLLLFKAVLITRPFDLVSFYPKSKTTLLQSQNIDTFGVTFVGVNFVFVLTLELALSCSVYLVKSRNFINELLKCLFDISSLSLQFLLSTTWNFLIFEESHIHFFSMWFWRGGCLKVWSNLCLSCWPRRYFILFLFVEGTLVMSCEKKKLP